MLTTDITEDILVLVEPGTPVGSANCREARAMLLGIGYNYEELGCGSSVLFRLAPAIFYFILIFVVVRRSRPLLSLISSWRKVGFSWSFRI